MKAPNAFSDFGRLKICFAHSAYGLAEEFARRQTGIKCIEARTADALTELLPQADVLVVSGLWRNSLLDRAQRLRFIQSISSGSDQYDIAALRARGIRLASAAGVNTTAVAEHALALMLSLNRRLHLARDSQRSGRWDVGEPGIANRPAELFGRSVLIVGLGHIGRRVAELAHSFSMRVAAVNRTRRPLPGSGTSSDLAQLRAAIAAADFIVLTCSLDQETRGLIGSAELAAMRPSAVLINVSRGPIVVQDALIAALRAGRLRGAGLDCFEEEPLPGDSPLWAMSNVVITPHLGGETPRYETRVIDILLENLDRLRRGELQLKNQVA